MPTLLAVSHPSPDARPVNLLAGKKWFSWTRLICVAGTVALVWLVLRKVEFDAFAVALKRTSIGWCLAAFAVYGLALAVQSWRWHLSLRAIQHAVHFMASWRLAMVGHFFFTVFFGMAGGDAAKSAFYARWFRHPLPEVLAAAPLDRGLSLGGALVLAVATWMIAWASGGLDTMRSLSLQSPGFWVLAGILLAAVIGIALVIWKPRGESAWARTIRAFREGGGRMALSPRLAGGGLFIATLGHFALSAVFALNLHAVSEDALPWAQLAWTIPAITTISCLPFTVAGAGVREVAAVTLLGLYGVPAGDCVAASMLTMVHKLVWAGVGASVLWKEQGVQERTHQAEPLETVSVVIPALNEAEDIVETLRCAKANPEVAEIILVDGGSTDCTREIAASMGCRVIQCEPGRGGQLRAGSSQAKGDVLLLLHADTWLPPNAGRAALDCLRDGSVVGGGFWKVFRDPPLLLRGSRFKCATRLVFGNLVLGDQAMFIRREILERIGGVPSLPLMEEFELCRKLRKAGRLALAEATVTTSARRFVKLGIFRTYFRMWSVTIRYWMGASPEDLWKSYEKKSRPESGS